MEQLPCDADCDASLAVVEPVEGEESAAPEWTGPRCEKCSAAIASDVVSVCRNCGWYASLGTFVEVDRNWEAATSAADQEDQAADAKPKSHLRVWLDMMPRWSWLMIASVLAVVVESVAIRLATPAESWLRSAWSLSQLGLGVLVAAGCHLFYFLVMAAEDATVGVLDLVLKPLKLWSRAVQNLPKRLWVANAGVCGVAAAVMSITVIGGIPYERLWDWGFEPPVKQNLMGAVMDRAKNLDSRGSDNLEDAIADFAGSGDAADGESPTPTPAKPREREDCVILGYELDREGRLSKLLLGSPHRGKLVYAGSVSLNLPDEELAALLERLVAIRAMRAFIPVEAEATWVHPRLTCRVTFAERDRSGVLRELEWDRLLGAIDPR